MVAKPGGKSSDSPAVAALNEAVIVQAACTLISESGTEGLTVRALSDRLGVALGATYHHIANRQALLTLVARELFSRVELPADDTTEWRAALRKLLIDIVAVFKQHSGMVTFHLGQNDETHAAELGRVVRSILRRAGFKPQSSREVMAAMFFYLNGVLQSAPRIGRATVSDEFLREAFLDGLDLLFDGAEAQLRVDLGN
jgi:AcrR family transcriptional regulator